MLRWFTKVNGWKTYTVAILMVGAGVAAKWAAPTPTWDVPDELFRHAIYDMVGWLLIIHGLGLAAYRHALTTTATRILEAFDIVKDTFAELIDMMGTPVDEDERQLSLFDEDDL